MKEKEFLQKLKNKEERMLLSMVLDRYHSFSKYNIPTCSNFLSEVELSFLENPLKHLKIPYKVFVANKFCERSIVYFGDYSEFVSFYSLPNNNFRHSDVLGSLFGCGFCESMIGDIFVTSDFVYFTSLEKYDFMLEHSFNQIGRVKVTLEKIDELPEIKREFKDITFNIESVRLDLIVSKLLKQSRSKTLDYMKEYKILLNYKPVSKHHENLKEGDILSIEKVGKFKVFKIDNSMKKIKLFLKQYC